MYLAEGEIKWVYRETQMQWMLTEEEEKTEHVITAESLVIWPKIVGKGIEQE